MPQLMVYGRRRRSLTRKPQIWTKSTSRRSQDCLLTWLCGVWLQEETIKKVQEALDLDKTDPKKEEATKQVQEEIKQWVARYRRDNSVAGKPSFT